MSILTYYRLCVQLYRLGVSTLLICLVPLHLQMISTRLVTHRFVLILLFLFLGLPEERWSGLLLLLLLLLRLLLRSCLEKRIHKVFQNVIEEPALIVLRLSLSLLSLLRRLPKQIELILIILLWPLPPIFIPKTHPKRSHSEIHTCT